MFRAYTPDGDWVALKKLIGPSDEVSLGRFQREIAVLERLNHPNVVRIFGSGSHDGVMYYTMEALEGETLRGRLKLSSTCDIIQQAAQGLQALHDLGIVHRDVKPQNLFRCSDSVVKILDFGLAKNPQDTIRVTVAGQGAAGTPLYMPPEVAPALERREVELTPAYDQFSLAVVAYELLTGERPFLCQRRFRGADLSSVFYSGLRSLSEFDMQPLEDVEAVLRRALKREPENRYPSVDQFARELCAAGGLS